MQNLFSILLLVGVVCSVIGSPTQIHQYIQTNDDGDLGSSFGNLGSSGSDFENLAKSNNGRFGNLGSSGSDFEKLAESNNWSQDEILRNLAKLDNYGTGFDSSRSADDSKEDGHFQLLQH